MMKIVITQAEDDVGLMRERMEIDGKYVLSVGPLCECPEDAIIGRDLVGCHDVFEYMKKAWTAAKRGEELESVVKTVPLEEW